MGRVARARVGRWLGLWVGVLGLTGCSNSGFFVCTEDSECTEADGGRCEPSGACSIPDASCPTGRRYGQLGNPDVAGQCVPADDIGSTRGEATGGSGDASSGTTIGSTAEQSDSVASSMTTEVSSSEASGGSTAAGTSSSTGPVVPRDIWSDCETAADCSELCAPVVDIASLVPIAHWCTGFDCDDPALDCSDPGTGAVPDCLALEFDGEVAPRCILDCTDTGTTGCPDGMECFDVFMSVSRCAHPVSESP